jgi:hypothetical protein
MSTWASFDMGFLFISWSFWKLFPMLILKRHTFLLGANLSFKSLCRLLAFHEDVWERDSKGGNSTLLMLQIMPKDFYSYRFDVRRDKDIIIAPSWLSFFNEHWNPNGRNRSLYSRAGTLFHSSSTHRFLFSMFPRLLHTSLRWIPPDCLTQTAVARPTTSILLMSMICTHPTLSLYLFHLFSNNSSCVLSSYRLLLLLLLLLLLPTK